MQVLIDSSVVLKIQKQIQKQLRYLIVMATFVALAMALVPIKAQAIVNGEVVSYPWAVAFAQPNDGRAIERRVYCSGVLIKPNWVLTAAHCAPQAGDLAIIGRSRLASTGGQVRYVSSSRYFMVNSSKYCVTDRKSELCDIALMKLTSSSSLEDADIANSSVVSEWGDSSVARSYGYGYTSIYDSKASSYLRRARTDIVDFRDNHYTLFARGANSSVCIIDSGGPLIVSTSQGPKVVGIVRATTSSAPTSTYCQPGSTNSYTKVGSRGSLENSRPFYWIQSIVN